MKFYRGVTKFTVSDDKQDIYLVRVSLNESQRQEFNDGTFVEVSYGVVEGEGDETGENHIDHTPE